MSTIDQRYSKAFAQASDIQSHMPMLRQLASEADRVVEFGVRSGVSTVALLSGRPRWMRSYDVRPFELGEILQREVWPDTDFEFVQADDLTVAPVQVDLLFVDTIHTAEQLAAELRIHGGSARRIALHDTTTFGAYDEYGGPGLLSAMRGWLAANSNWSIAYDSPACNGLTVLERRS